MKEIKKLSINLIETEEKYKKDRAKYIAEYEVYIKSTREYHPGGLFYSDYYTGEEGHYKKDPVQGEAEWNKKYPNGYDDWKNFQQNLNSYGQQLVINKINEIISFLTNQH